MLTDAERTAVENVRKMNRDSRLVAIIDRLTAQPMAVVDEGKFKALLDRQIEGYNTTYIAKVILSSGLIYKMPGLEEIEAEIDRLQPGASSHVIAAHVFALVEGKG